LAVVTQPDRPVGRNLKVQPPPIKVRAESLQIPIFQPATTKTQDFVDQMASLKPDILVVVAYGEILRRNLLELAPRGAVNLHASLLPKYRGAAPIPWAILNGESETGVTTMQVDIAMDAGPVYLKQTCTIDSSDTSETLANKLATLGAPLLTKTLDLIEKNEIVAEPQDISAVTFAPKLKKEDGRVDWNKPASWIARQVRAFDPWPGTFTTFENISVKFWNAKASDKTTDEPSGTVLYINKDAISVAAGERSVLDISDVQPENRPRMKAHDFAIGHRLQPGKLFG
jgi:methionyl-tRNA formyltransferase